MRTQVFYLSLTKRATRLFLGCMVGGALAMLAAGVWAQGASHPIAPEAEDQDKAGGPDQRRRVALRAALVAQREAVAPKPDRPARHLSPTERAALREQLRRQRRAGPKDRKG